jgi:hypothetical protein
MLLVKQRLKSVRYKIAEPIEVKPKLLGTKTLQRLSNTPRMHEDSIRGFCGSRFR